MRKYLMTGVAAIALCAAFTSCSSKDELYNPEQIRQNEIASVYDNYDKAFIQTFGQPAANQDWGFGRAAGTRNNGIDNAINVNGNMWTECPGVRVNEEVDAIFDYVKNGTEWMTQNNKPFSTTAPQNLNGYFVTQVRSGNNNYADNTYTNIYNNNQEVKNVGSWMNHLQIAFNQNPSMTDLNNATSDNVSGWQHINNFNASSNIDWGASDSKEKGNTKVENKGAFDFAYYNSLDSKYHNKWILVDGANISSDPYYADFYYVCFDFESVPSTNKTHYHYKDANGQSQNGELVGTYFTNEEVAAELARTGVTGRTDIDIYRWEQGDKMLKGDNVYTDWIVRITKGEKEIDNGYDVRIIAEDLNAKANDSAPAKDGLEESDWDFNDVVFDIKFKDGDKADIHVVCVGGVLPLYVAGQEVHELCGQSKGTDGLYKILGTVDARVFEVSNVNRNNYKDNVKIEVGKVLSDGTTEIFELPAPVGKPAAKIAVKTSYVPCGERVDIRTQYHQFGLWITNSSVIWY